MSNKLQPTGNKSKNDLVGPGTNKATIEAASKEVRVPNGAAVPELKRIKVIAKRELYYQHKTRREGDVFVLVPLRTVERDAKGQPKIDPKTRKPIPKVMTAMEQFSHNSMEFARPEDGLSISTSADAMKKKHDEILQDKYALAGGDDEGEQSGDIGNEDEEDDNVIGTGNQDVV